MNKLKSGILMVCIVASLLALPVKGYAAEAAPLASISLSSNQSEVSLNHEVSVSIQATDSAGLYGSEFYVTYDPQVFTYVRTQNSSSHSIYMSEAATEPGKLYLSVVKNGSSIGANSELGNIIFKAINTVEDSELKLSTVKGIMQEAIVVEVNGKYYHSMSDHQIEGTGLVQFDVKASTGSNEQTTEPVPTPTPEHLTNPEQAPQVLSTNNQDATLTPLAVPITVNTPNSTSTTLYAYDVNLFNQEFLNTQWPLSSEANNELLGLYYFNEQTNTWDYVRNVTRTATTINATLSKSGKYAVMTYSADYSDTSRLYDEALRAIEILSARQIIQGVSDSEFAPNKTLTRAEWIAMLVRATGLTKSTDSDSKFTDVAEDAWYKDALQIAASHRLITGYEDGAFRGDNAISRADLAVLIARLGHIINSSTLEARFADSNNIPSYALDAVNFLSNSGVLRGFEDGTFRPMQSSTRAEAAILLLRTLQK